MVTGTAVRHGSLPTSQPSSRPQRQASRAAGVATSWDTAPTVIGEAPCMLIMLHNAVFQLVFETARAAAQLR